jgi:hypothetical protein
MKSPSKEHMLELPCSSLAAELPKLWFLFLLARSSKLPLLSRLLNLDAKAKDWPRFAAVDGCWKVF